MKFDIQVQEFGPNDPPRIGNVYPVKGGRGLRYGHMMVLFAITTPKETWQGQSALMVVVDKEGQPQGVTSYGMHYVENLCPIAFVDGLDEVEFTMRPIS